MTITAEHILWERPPKADRLTPLYQRPTNYQMEGDMSATDYEGILIELRKNPGQPARVQVARKSRSSVNTWKLKGADSVARRNTENPMLFDIYAWWPESQARPQPSLSKRPTGNKPGRPRGYMDVDADEVRRRTKTGPSKIDIEYTAVPAIVRNPNLPALPSSPYIADDGTDPVFTQNLLLRKQFEADRRARGIPPEGLAPIKSRMLGQADYGKHHTIPDIHIIPDEGGGE